MKTSTWHISTLHAKAEGRPEGYLDALLACAVAVEGELVTFDQDGACWRLLREMYGRRGDVEVAGPGQGCCDGAEGEELIIETTTQGSVAAE